MYPKIETPHSPHSDPGSQATERTLDLYIGQVPESGMHRGDCLAQTYAEARYVPGVIFWSVPRRDEIQTYFLTSWNRLRRPRSGESILILIATDALSDLVVVRAQADVHFCSLFG